MAAFTDKQMKMAMYIGGGIIALQWLRAQSNGNTMTEQIVKDAVDAVVVAAKAAGKAVADQVIAPTVGAIKAPFVAVYTEVQNKFLSDVKDAGGIGLQNEWERQIALSYMTEGSTMMMPAVGFAYTWWKAKAYLAAKAVKQYRYDLIDLEKRTNTKNPWGQV